MRQSGRAAGWQMMEMDGWMRGEKHYGTERNMEAPNQPQPQPPQPQPRRRRGLGTGEAARHLHVLWHRNEIDITASYSYSSDSTITYSSYSDHPTARQYIT